MNSASDFPYLCWNERLMSSMSTSQRVTTIRINARSLVPMPAIELYNCSAKKLLLSLTDRTNQKYKNLFNLNSK